MVDYFSRYPEIYKLSTTTSQGVINALRLLFARHGVPEILRSDNGTQYVSQEMTKFSVDYGFQQITSSPHYPKSNGLAERTIQTIKMMLEKSTDPFLVLFSYHATPLQWCGLRVIDGEADKDYFTTSYSTSHTTLVISRIIS